MKLKKTLAVLSAFCMMCAVVPFLPESFQQTAVISAKADKEYENFKYFVEYDDTVTITGVIDTLSFTGEVVIPATIDGYPVTAIADNAFYYGGSDTASVTSIILPDGIKTIGARAFAFLMHLTSIEIPDSVTSIGEYAFTRCESLTSVTLPKNLTKIQDGTFNSCYKLASINIPDGVTSIGDSAFANCSDLHSIVLPESVTSLGKYIVSGADYNIY